MSRQDGHLIPINTRSSSPNDQPRPSSTPGDDRHRLQDNYLSLANSSVIPNLIDSGQLSAGDFAESMDLDHALATSPRYDLQTWQAMDQDVAYALHLQELEYSEDPTPTHPYFATATKSDFGGRSTMSDAALAKQIQAIEYEQVSDQRASSSPPQLTGSSSENIPMPSFLRRAASPVSNINGAVTNLIRVMGRRGRAAATTRGRHRSGVNLQENPDDFGPDAYETLLELDHADESAGAKKHQIDALPTDRYRGAPTTSEGDAECSICMEAFQLNDPLRRLPCFHVYHPACIDRWLQGKNECPVCKAKAT